MGIIKMLVLFAALAYIVFYVFMRRRPPLYGSGVPPVPVDNPVRSCYVANMGTDSVTVFEINDADGLLNPVAARTLGGILAVDDASSGLLEPYDLAVTPDGDLYVLALNGEDQPTTISIFAPGSYGSMAPRVQYPNGNVEHATGLALRRVPLTLMATIVDEGNNGVVELKRDPTGDGDPLGSLSGAATTLVAPSGIAVSLEDGTIWVVGPTQDQVAVFAAYHPSQANTLPPSRTIAGSNTRLSQPVRVAVDSGGSIYVTNRGTAMITIYPPGAGGNVPPSRTIGGPGTHNTGLTNPMGIAVDPDGRIYVGNDDSLLVFAADSAGDAVPAQRIAATPQNMFAQITGVAYRVPPPHGP